VDINFAKFKAGLALQEKTIIQWAEENGLNLGRIRMIMCGATKNLKPREIELMNRVVEGKDGL